MAGKDPISQLGDLAALQTNADNIIDIITTIKEAIKSVPDIALAYKNTQGGTELKKSTEDLIKANNDLLNSQKALDVERAKTLSLEGDIAKQIAVQRELNKAKTTDMRQEAREAAGLNDAYKKLELQYNAAQRAAKNLAATPGTPKAAIDEANQKALALSNQLKVIDASVGQHQRNVGNYTGALRTLDRSLEDAKGKLDNLTKAGRENTSQGVSLQREIEMLNGLVNQNAKGFASLTMEVRSGERALATMAAAGLEDTESFEKMQLSVISAHKALNEFNKGQRLLEDPAPMLQSATLAAKALAGTYAVGAGAASLFADGDEKVEKELNKLIAIMTIIQGLTEIHEMMERKGAITTAFNIGLTKIKNFVMTGSTESIKKNTAATLENAGAEEVAATATKATSAAMVGLRIAMMASGIGLLLLLLPSVAEAMKGVGDATKDTKEMEEELEEVNAKMSDGYAQEKVNVELTVAQLKDENISRAEKKKLIDDLQEKYPDYLGNIKNEGSLTTELSDAIKTKLIPALELEAKAKAAQELAGEKYKEMLELQNKKVGETASLWQKARMAVGAYSGNVGVTMDALGDAFQKRKEDVKELQDSIDSLFKISLDADEGLSKLGKGSSGDGGNAKNAFTDYEEGFKQLREEIQKFQNEAFGKDLSPYLKSLADLQERYQETFIKINDTRDKDFQKVQENAQKGVITAAHAAALRVKIEQDSDQQKLQAEQAYYMNLNVMQEKQRAEVAAKAKENADKELQAAIENQKKIAKAMAGDADVHFREQVTVAKNNQKAQPTFGNDKALAGAERDEQMHNLTTLLQEKKITQAEYDSDMAAVQDDYNKKITAAQNKQLQTYADRTKAVFNDVAAIEKAAEERRINALERQIQLNDKLKEAETSRIQNSTLSESQRAAMTEMLQAQTAAKNAVLQRQVQEEKQKEARFDKEKGIMDAIVNTYVNASRVSYDPIQEALVIAAGIAAVAEISAQKIPAYAGGTDHSKPGWALTDERGPEGYVTPSGKTFMGNNQPTLRFLEAGTKIIPHEKLRDYQSMQLLPRVQQDRQLERKLDQLNGTMERMEQLGREQVSAFRKQKTVYLPPSQDPGPEFWAKIHKACS